MMETKRPLDFVNREPKATAEARERVKVYNAARKQIKRALEGKELTIPEIAEETGMEQEDVTYYLMTMRKFGEVDFVDDDDVDEYYSYRLKE